MNRNGQKWTEKSRNRQKWTEIDRNGHNMTIMDSNIRKKVYRETKKLTCYKLEVGVIFRAT